MRLHLIDLSFESCWFVCHSLIINDEICYSQICLKMALVTPLCPKQSSLGPYLSELITTFAICYFWNVSFYGK